jgi:hypothetical protein
MRCGGFHLDIAPVRIECQALNRIYQEWLLLEPGFFKDIKDRALSEIGARFPYRLADIDSLFDGNARNAEILQALIILSEKIVARSVAFFENLLDWLKRYRLTTRLQAPKLHRSAAPF